MSFTDSLVAALYLTPVLLLGVIVLGQSRALMVSMVDKDEDGKHTHPIIILMQLLLVVAPLTLTIWYGSMAWDIITN